MNKKILTTLLILLISYAFAQEKIRIHKSHLDVRGDVISFTSRTINHKNPNKLVNDPNMFFIQSDPNFTSEYYFNTLGFLYESKTQEKGYTWKKYEFTDAPVNLTVIKITALSKRKIKEKFQPNYVMNIECKDHSADVTTTLNNGDKQTIRRYFDEKENVIKEQLVPEGEKEFTYLYDNGNRLIERKRNNGDFTKYEYETDQNGEIIKKTEINQNDEKRVMNYENGRVVSEIFPTYTLRYEYSDLDKFGNWTKKTIFLNDVLISEEYREFWYR